MGSLLATGGSRERREHRQLAVEAQIGGRHDAIGLAEHGRADQGDLGGDPTASESFDVLDARVTE